MVRLIQFNVSKVSLCLTLMLCGAFTIAERTSAHAALLDGMLEGVEESIAQHVAKKGDKLKTGNFYTAEKPNAHGPIGMMGDHTHDIGEYMFTYRLMHMWMQGNRNGTTQISEAQALALGQHMVVPQSMRMNMHMFGFMYGVNDTVTFTAMVPYILKNMNHRNAPSTRKFTTRSEGIGDIQLGTLLRLWAVEAPSIGAHRFHFNFSVSIPTGNIQPTDSTPLAPNDGILPYPMHLGSGTFDLYPGITYAGEAGRASWGFQTIGTLRLGENRNDFTMGNAYVVNIHTAYEVIKNWLSGSVRLSFNHWEDYSGADPRISQTVVQTGVPSRLGGERLDVLGGMNVLMPEFMGFETRLALEGGVPVYQWLKGQLETDSIVTFGLQGIY